ncbi:hypothetical protein ACJ41O_007212 [Fusarium nematophilum]
MQYRMILAASLALGANALPAPPQVTKAPRADLAKRQQPDSAGSSVLDAPMTIAAGETFDGGNVMFDRGVSCTGQEEGGDSDAVFILEAGASLSNVIIGPNQVEGVHCNGGCTITNVWWDAVCEDAFSIKKQADGETTTINGGGAKGAEDKVIQHNGGGTVVINDFTVSDFGKMYRSCGNCDDMPARHVKVTGGTASDGKILVGINPNMGDTAEISGVSLTNVGDECIAFNGVTDGSEPEEVGPCENTGSGSGGSATSAAGGEATSAAGDDSAAPTSAAGDSESAPTSAAEESEIVPTSAAEESNFQPTSVVDDSQSTPTSVDDNDDSDDNNDDQDDSADEEADDSQDDSADDQDDSSDDQNDFGNGQFDFGGGFNQ